MKWETMDTAPETGEPFLAWYDGPFGPPFGAMVWQPGKSEAGGRFHSYTMGTQSKFATHWIFPDKPTYPAVV